MDRAKAAVIADRINRLQSPNSITITRGGNRQEHMMVQAHNEVVDAIIELRGLVLDLFVEMAPEYNRKDPT